MRYLFVICLLFFFGGVIHAQSSIGSTEDAVMIGNIDMKTVIIHVYKSKQDQWPYKEFSIVEDEETGEKRVVPSSIKGKSSKGGFIIVNGLKPMEEIQRMVSGSKVYEELVVKDVPKIEEYELIISDYLRESIINDSKNKSLDDPTEEYHNDRQLVGQDSIIEDGVFYGYRDRIKQDEIGLDGAVNKIDEIKLEDANITDVETLIIEETNQEDVFVEEEDDKNVVATKVSQKKSKKTPPYKAPKYKSKYGQRKSKSMASRTRPKKNKKTVCYKFKRR